MKRCWIDVETTGTNPSIHGIVQLAMIIEINGQERECHKFDICPLAGTQVDLAALQANGLTMDEIMSYPHAVDIFVDLFEILGRHVDRFDRADKFHFVGYNARFDMDFLRAFFESMNNKFFGSWFWFPPIDVMALAAHGLMSVRSSLPNFKLETVARYLGLDVSAEETHNALYDIRLTQQVYQRLWDQHDD